MNSDAVLSIGLLLSSLARTLIEAIPKLEKAAAGTLSPEDRAKLREETKDLLDWANQPD